MVGFLIQSSLRSPSGNMTCVWVCPDLLQDLSWSSPGAGEGEMQMDSWGKENLDRVGFLQLEKERCSVLTVLNYKSYATLDSASRTQVEQAPPEKRSEKAPKNDGKKFSPQ